MLKVITSKRIRTSFHPILILILSLCCFYCSAGDILKNPGFEQDEDGNGFPDHWTRQRLAVIERDPVEAFEGNVSVRTSSRHGFLQRLKPPARTRLFFSGFLKAETGKETGLLASDFRDQGVFLDYQSRRIPLSTDYSLYGVSFLIPPLTDTVTLIFSSLFTTDWAQGDAFSLLDEFIHNPGFEDVIMDDPQSWYQVGNPEFRHDGLTAFSGEGEVQGDDSNYYFQEMAVYPDKTYFFYFHARTGDGTVAPEILEPVFYDRDGIEAGKAQISFTASQVYGKFSGQFTPPENAVYMRLPLRPAGGTRTPLWFDSLSISACGVRPRIFSPNDDDVYDTTTAFLLLPRESMVSMEIRDVENNTIRTLSGNQAASPGILTAEWNGLTEEGVPASPGDYMIRSSFSNDFIGDVSVECIVTIEDMVPLGGNAPDFSDFFPQGAWVHLGGRYGERINIPDHFNRLSGDGFNTVIAMNYPFEKAHEIISAAGQSGLSLIVHALEMDELIMQYPDYAFDAVPEDQYRQTALDEADIFSTSPSLLGYYITDEVPDENLEPAGIAVRTLRDADPLHPAFSSIQPANNLEERLLTMDTPALLHHYYPFLWDSPVEPDIFDGFLSDLEKASNIARENDRPLWLILQAFSIEGALRMPTDAEMRCQVWLAMASGAKGIFYFLTQSIYQITGLFSFDSIPFDIYDDTMRLNEEISTLAPVLLDLEPVNISVTAPADQFTNMMSDSSGTPYLFCVNKDCLTTRSVEPAIDLTGISEIRDVLTGESVAFYMEAGRTRIPVTLSPGSGVLFRIERLPGAPPPRIVPPREAFFAALSIPYLPFPDFPVSKSVREKEGVVSDIPLMGRLRTLEATPDRLYVGAETTGLYVISVSDAQNPQYLQGVSDLHHYGNLFAEGNNVFCSDPTGGLLIFEKSDTGLIQTGEWWGHSGSPLHAIVEDDRAFLASDYLGLTVLDMKKKTAPSAIGRGVSADNARYVLKNDQYVYLLDEFRGIHVEDVSTTNPQRISTIPLNSPWRGEINRDLMAVSCMEYGLKIFSLADPSAPVLEHDVTEIRCDDVAFWRDRWIFCASGEKGIAVMEMEDDGPRLLEYFQPLPGYFARRIVISDPWLYVFYPGAGVYVISPGRLLAPEITPTPSIFYFY